MNTLGYRFRSIVFDEATKIQVGFLWVQCVRWKVVVLEIKVQKRIGLTSGESFAFVNCVAFVVGHFNLCFFLNGLKRKKIILSNLVTHMCVCDYLLRTSAKLARKSINI